MLHRCGRRRVLASPPTSRLRFTSSRKAPLDKFVSQQKTIGIHKNQRSGDGSKLGSGHTLRTDAYLKKLITNCRIQALYDVAMD